MIYDHVTNLDPNKIGYKRRYWYKNFSLLEMFCQEVKSKKIIMAYVEARKIKILELFQVELLRSIPFIRSEIRASLVLKASRTSLDTEPEHFDHFYTFIQYLKYCI